ncbi:MAG: sugar ABC transporter substrate-binding protein [bacterium]|nr:sugar ABC transporter substrate-binding protein [bacterium]
MKRYLVCILALLLIVAIPLCAGAKKTKIGFVLAGPDIFYATEMNVFKKLAQEAGWKVQVVSSEYSASKEIANGEDFIAKKVDAIVIITSNPQSAAEVARKAKAADIPIFFLESVPLPDVYDIPVAIVSGDWVAMGFSVGEYVGKKYPDSKIALIEGVYGQGIAEGIRDGFIQGIESTGAGYEIVFKASGKWQRKEGMDAAQDLIASRKEFDVLYVMNEAMMGGVLQALKEAGKEGQYKLFSDNGTGEGIEWIKQGIMEGTCANPPSANGDLMFQMVKAHFEGKDHPKHVIGAQPFLTKDNVDSSIPWDIDTYFKQKAAGAFEVDIYTQPQPK